MKYHLSKSNTIVLILLLLYTNSIIVFVYGLLQPYHQQDSILYLESWDIHSNNTHQSLFINHNDYTIRQSIQNICHELLFYIPQPPISSSTTTYIPNDDFIIVEHIVTIPSASSSSSNTTTTPDPDTDTIISSRELHDQCYSNNNNTNIRIVCIIPKGITVLIHMNSNSNNNEQQENDTNIITTRKIENTNTTIHVITSLYAIIVRGGKFLWYTSSSSSSATNNEQQQQQQHFVLCTGYIAVEQGGSVFSVINGYKEDDNIIQESSTTTTSNTPIQQQQQEEDTGLSDDQTHYHKVWIYICNNGATHPVLGSRVLGAIGIPFLNNTVETTTYTNTTTNSSNEPDVELQQPQIIIRDRTTHLTTSISNTGSTPSILRTWSLLAISVHINDTIITCIHDPIYMGWNIGDRIAIAPSITDRTTNIGLRAQTFIISNFIYNNNTNTNDNNNNGINTITRIVLNEPSKYEFRGRSILSPSSNDVIFDSSEVILLSRNTIITGDDFTEIPCNNNITYEVYPGFGTSTEGCYCSPTRSSCTVGLHTIHMYGGITQIDNVRIEYCGQRGIEGKYCLHLHRLNDCPDCYYTNNAIEYSQQRGIVIHDTHRANIEMNVLYNIRGAAIYIEDGNEYYNRFAYNVAICPWMFDEEGGCTVPGTSNDQADTALNQAGIYMENSMNDFIGNRMANHFNGIFLNPTNGHGSMEGRICTNHMNFGHWEGNTYHSSGRFGTYGLNDNYPLQTKTATSTTTGIDSFLLTVPSTDEFGNINIDYGTCSILTSDGYDMGQVTTLWNNFDYGNAFVGHYGAGDIQYKYHSSINNLNNIYWKETKSFQDGCTAHISHSYFVNGSMALPDTIGSFIIEHTTLENIFFSMNHHCGIGVTGFLCMPHYVLDNVHWINPDENNQPSQWVSFTESNQAESGGIISVVSTTETSSQLENSSNTSFFPDNYVSLVSAVYPYLLNTGFCVLSGDLGYGLRYDSGILCNETLQTFRIYSNGTDEYPLLLQVYTQSFEDRASLSYNVSPIATQEIGVYFKDGGKKRGYKFPVLPHSDLFYDIRLIGGSGNIPLNWFIDFGDTTLTNRYGISTLQIYIQGRTCPINGVIQSNHDRLFLSTANDLDIYTGSTIWGHGACTDHPDTPITNCNSELSYLTVDDDETQSSLKYERGCPDLCNNMNCTLMGGFCHCLLRQCQCRPGRYGSMCEYDICSNCSPHSGCASRYLGSTLSVSYQPCLCEDGWFGEFCQYGVGVDNITIYETNIPSTVSPTQPPPPIPTSDGSEPEQPTSFQIETSSVLYTVVNVDSIMSTWIFWCTMMTAYIVGQ